MINLEDLRTHVEKDCKIDGVDLDKESLSIPQLHNKYLNFYTDCKLYYKKLKNDYSILKKRKWEYYTGKMSKEEMDQLKWTPFHLKLLRQDVDMYLESDEDIIKLSSRIAIEEEKIQYLDSVLKSIMNRHWQIRSAIEWRKFTNGVS